MDEEEGGRSRGEMKASHGANGKRWTSQTHVCSLWENPKKEGLIPCKNNENVGFA